MITKLAIACLFALFLTSQYFKRDVKSLSSNDLDEAKNLAEHTSNLDDQAVKNADKTTFFNPVVYQNLQDLTNRTIDKTLNVGSIAGVVNVGALGNATYTIPIEVPPGVGDMMPNLSINYAGAGNSTLGHGWNLGGLSAITRTSSSSYFDNMSAKEYYDAIDFDAEDRFALDGQRLMNINQATLGKYFDNVKPSETYRTFMDGYAEIITEEAASTYSPAVFKVATKDNKMRFYGELSSPLSRFYAQNSTEVLAWFISKEIDIINTAVI